MTHNKGSQKTGSTRGRAPLGALLAIGAGVLVLAVVSFMLLARRPAGSSAGAGLTPASTPGPRLQADQQSVDLGQLPLGRMVQATFKITNIGDQPLQFTQAPYIEVVEGCCPPNPALGSMLLRPGEQTTLSMQFMMHAGMGGRHNFRVHVFSNDPSQPEQTLTVLSDWVN